jgi:adenosylmethionine-8-amino-7-oxononanoate aminotransferase
MGHHRALPFCAVERRLSAAVAGSVIWDAAGNKYLDGSAAVNFISHGVPEIGRHGEQAGKLEFVHTSQFTTPVAEEYAQELLAFAGEHFQGGAVYFTCGGSESIETALKLARQYQVEIGQDNRYQILSRQQSYHGSTLGALSVSGNKRRREIYLPMVREFAHIGMPYCYRCDFDCTDGCRDCGQQHAAELEHAIEASNGEAAAFMNPSAAPLVVLRRDTCNRSRKSAERTACFSSPMKSHDGAHWPNFAVEHSAVAPDILVTAKGLSSGYAPLGAVIASKKVVDAIATGSGAFLHGFTYNAHPISLAAGRAVLRHLQSKNLVNAADSTNPGTPATHFKQALETLRTQDTVGDVRGIGLLWAVEFVADKSTKRPFPPDQNYAGRVGAAALKRGLLVYPMQGSVDGTSGDHLLLAPPAVITQDQIAWSVETLAAAVREAT